MINIPAQKPLGSKGWAIRLSWTNWTFGVWWGKFKTIGPAHFGIDLGPLELMYTKPRR